MKVLVACEFSGVVREAFRAKGHDVLSCDLLPSDDSSSWHYQGNMFTLDLESFDLIIAHPPCTAVCVSGNRYYANTQARLDGVAFIEQVWDIDCERLVIENPVGVINSLAKDMPRPQYIQPWQFGHGETKKTGLWKCGVPDLVPSNIVSGHKDRIHKLPPSADRGRIRSRTYQGIADAMADQWG